MWRALAVLAAMTVLAVAGSLTYGCLAAPHLVRERMAAASAWTPARALNPRFVEILLKVEDPAFFTHHGVDLSTPGAGLTTITQALCKDLFFDRFRPGLRKIPQTLFALALDRRVSKEDQLDLFVNTVYMGHHEGRLVEGLPAAARAYHGKDLRALTEEEFVQLVAMIMGADGLNVASRPEANAKRAARIREMLAGRCRAEGLRDVELAGCDP